MPSLVPFHPNTQGPDIIWLAASLIKKTAYWGVLRAGVGAQLSHISTRLVRKHVQ